MSQIFIEIGIIILLLLANGVFAMAEIAVVSSRRARLEHLASSGDRLARKALALKESPNRFLATVQIGITLVGIVAGVFGGATLAGKLGKVLPLGEYSEPAGYVLVVTLITYLSLVIGELIPKRIGLGNPEGVAKVLAGPMNQLSKIASPFVTFLSASTDGLLKLLGIKPAQEVLVTEDELRLMARESLRGGFLRKSETEMVESVLSLDRLQVREVMTPRYKMIWIAVTDSHDHVWHKIVVSGHTRFPVYEGTRDRVVGILSVKALYANLAAGAGTNIRDLMTPPTIVPETMDCTTLLETFKKSGRHMAIVADEFSQTIGLVTVHDILEAIAGDISTPQQRQMPSVRKGEDGSWLVDASIEIEAFNKFFPDYNLCAMKPCDYHTFAGYILNKLGALPKEGDTFEDQGFTVEILDMDGLRVDKVLLTPQKGR